MEGPSTFEKRLNLVMGENLGNEAFGASELADQLNLSRAQLHRKIHVLTGNSTTHYMRNYRLEKAKDLLANTDQTVAEIGYQCGFNSATYFSRVFTHHFNKTPGQFRANSQIQIGSGQKRDTKNVQILIKAIVVLSIAAMSTWFIQNQKTIRGLSIPEFKAKSLVIQPLLNLNLTDEEKYICEGIRGAISSRLSAIEDLRVIHVSIGDLTDVKYGEIERLTGATHLMAGQIQRYQGTIRIEAYLIELNSGNQVWGETYDYEFDDTLKLQSELAERITQAMKVKLKLEDTNNKIGIK